MSVLSSARGGFDGAVVFDAFAGSGALGLEAISRGAAYALFAERDKAALQALESNIGKLGLDRGMASVRRGDVMKNPPTAFGRVFDLAFFDPPYAYEPAEVLSVLEALDAAGALSEEAIVAYEHDRSYDFEEDEAASQALVRLQLTIVSHKTYGDTAIDVMRRELQ